jgi:hypothetical protein
MRGGYSTLNGRYYGVGAPVFEVYVHDDDIERTLRRHDLLTFRAANLRAAKAKIRAVLPTIVFDR